MKHRKITIEFRYSNYLNSLIHNILVLIILFIFFVNNVRYLCKIINSRFDIFLLIMRKINKYNITICLSFVPSKLDNSDHKLQTLGNFKNKKYNKLCFNKT